MSDDWDDIFNEMRKLFKLNSDLFDVDFIIFPESDRELDLNKKNVKGFKISYHYESGMKDPEIKVEGDIDDKILRDYLNKYNIAGHPIFRNLKSSKFNRDIDAKALSLEPYEQGDKSRVIEPHTEINDFDEFSEIVVEVPGIEKEDIILSFNESGKEVTFSAHGKNRDYLKHIYLPFKPSREDYTLEVNNGIATLKVMK